MLKRISKWLLNIAVGSDRGLEHFQEMSTLAQTGAAAWLLAQERARLDFLAAKEALTRTGSLRAVPLVLQRFLKLQSTNAIIQSLLNEHHLERLIATAPKQRLPHEKASH